ncbi:MAG: hypothetical protein ABSD98_14425 [Candidatus Korobacteraceae bacterium]|jgi:hypothetical protein
MMSEVLTYRQISFDTANIHSLVSPVTFFDATYPSFDGSTRITEFDEKSVVRWLMLCPPCRDIILEELFLPTDAYYSSAIVRPFYSPGEGDIDLILCPRLSPHHAIALECKRVKVEIVNAGQDRINKLQDVAGGVRQANKLYNGPFAFFQTYLAVVTEAGASAQDGENIPMRGLRSHSTPQRGDTRTTTLRQLVEFPGRDDLDDDIGIVLIEIAQPSRLSIDRQATVRVCVYRRAKRRDQLDAVTRRVLEVLDYPDSHSSTERSFRRGAP